MKTGRYAQNLTLVAAIVGIIGTVGCKKDETTPIPTAAPPPVETVTPAPASTAPTEVKVEAPSITPRVKGEVDARDPEMTDGKVLAVTGAKTSFSTPKDWTVTKGAVNLASSADSKARIAATSFTTAEGATAKLDAAATALGLTDCKWNPPENLAAGKTRIPSTAADGLCKRGAADVATAYVAATAQNLLVVGAWDADGDSAKVFASMRTIGGTATGTGSAGGIGACCNALAQNAKSAPPEQQGAYAAAAGVCNAIRSNPQASSMMGQIQAALRGANMPASCR